MEIELRCVYKKALFDAIYITIFFPFLDYLSIHQGRFKYIVGVVKEILSRAK